MKCSFKRLFLTAIMFGIFVAFYCICSYAVSDTVAYQLDDLAMTVDIPTEVKVVTRGIKENDTLFADGTFDYIQTMSEIRENNIYLLGRNFSENYDIEIIMTEDENSVEYNNFKKLSSKMQEDLLNALSEKEEVSACSIYSTDSAIYFESLLPQVDTGSVCFSKEYYTVVNGKNITIKMISYDDQLTDTETAELKSIIDSIVFENTDNWNIVASFAETILCAIILTLGFIVIAVFKTKEITSPNNKLVRLITSSNITDNVSDNTPVSEEDEEESRMILDFLSTNKEIEERKNKDKEEISVEENNMKNSEKEEHVETIDISVDGITTEATEDDEDFNFLSENEFEFNEEENESVEDTDNNSTKIIQAESSDLINAVNEGEGKEESEGNMADIENKNAKAQQNNQTVPHEENNTESSAVEEEEVDLAAAIAYFEDDFESRRIRREEFRAKNKAKNKSIFGGIKKK